MGSRAVQTLSFFSPKSNLPATIFFKLGQANLPFRFLTKGFIHNANSKNQIPRNYSTEKSSLEPPDVPRLAETARISLAPHEAVEFAPKIKEVINWFDQLQAVDLESIEPAIRADTEADTFRDDLPETFENRESIIAALPSYEEPYIKVPKVLNKE